ncbi:MAG: T9SS type A sorting domain-containing protein [Flavobacterium sp.]|nr:T9SS type A sorting domain-containing protein [Flavobacterium sp.]
MKKITLLLLLMFGFTSILSAQCLEAVNGQWPFSTYTPATCDGLTVNAITTVGYASEYSLVNVTEGETYVFTSSNTSDYITISDVDGTVALAFGENAYVMWVSDVTGVIRFYTHISSGCEGDTESRTRGITCGTPPTCLPVVGLTLDNVTLDTADFSWTESMSTPTDGYDYYFGEGVIAAADITDPTAALPAGTTNISFDSLTDSTQYSFFVRANCGGGDTSAWVGGQFNTLVPPPDCTAAEVIPECGTEVSASLLDGNGAWNPFSCFYDTPGTEKLFSYTPPVTGVYSLTISAASGGYIDYFYKEASGSCDETGWNCIDDNVGPGTDVIGTLEAGTEYWILLDGEGTTARSATFMIACAPTCTNGVANYVRVADCENGNEQFSVDVNLTDMGTAVAYTVSDDQGSATQPLTDVGTVTFGPYAIGTSVIFTIANDNDDTCVLTSPVQTVANCPPTNDTCATAIDLTNLTSPIDGTTVDALNDYDGAGTCGTNTAPDVYYSIVVPANSTLTIGQTANNYDSRNYIFFGDCDNSTAIGCFDDPDYTSTVWTNDTGSDQTVYWVQDGYFSNQGTFTLAWSVIACTNATATYAIVSDCANGEQFLVDVNISSLGSATELSVSDDQGSAPQTTTDLSTLTFGPYPNNTPVIFTIANTTDSDCTIMSPIQNQVACPPSNDDCFAPMEVTASGDFATSFISGHNIGATHAPTNEIALPTCAAFGFDTYGGDVWYSVVVPESGSLTFETQAEDGTTMSDSGMQVFSGTCDALTSLGCSDDDGVGNFSLVSLTGLTPGDVLLARVWGYNANVGTFRFGAYDASLLGVSTFDGATFKAYPNPVTNMLNLSYSKNISNVEIFNLLGQQMTMKTINATQAQVDMSMLSVGTYLVKVTSDNQVKTIKVVKQ